MGDWQQNLNRLQVASLCRLAAICTLATFVLFSILSVKTLTQTSVKFTATECRFPIAEDRNVECGDLPRQDPDTA